MDVFEAVYIMYILFCTVSLPLWALLKRKRLKLSLVLIFIPILFGYLLYRYLFDSSDEDHGIAVAGLFFTVPLLSYVCQLVAIPVVNLVARAKRGGQ